MIKQSVFVFSVLFLFLLFPFVALAQEARGNETVILERNETVNKDYFAAGETVTLSGTVNGDAYLAGGTIFIDGTVNGDILVVGGTVSIRGTVTEDVRAAGGTVTISGDVGGNITIGAGTGNITDSAHIEGSAVAGAGTLEIFAPIGKGATIGAGNVTLGSEVNGDIIAGVGSISLTNNAKVNGDLTYYSEQDTKLAKASSASVSGKIIHNVYVKEETSKAKTAGAFTGFAFFLKLLSLLSSLVLGLLLLHFLPMFTKRTTERIETNFFLTFLIGLMTVVFIPILIVFLFITLVGIPLAILLILAFIALLFFAKIFAALYIGNKTMAFINQKPSVGWTLFIGIIIYGFITVIPIFGWIVSLMALFTGTGALLLEKKHLYSTLRSKKIF